MNDRIKFDNGTDVNSVVAHDNPFPVTGIAGIAAGIGDLDDPAVTDPTQDGSLIALAKGNLTKQNQMIALLQQGYTPTRMTANGTLTILNGAGYFGGIFLTKLGATANTLTIYDNTAASGTKLADLMDTTVGPLRLLDFKGARCGTGLTLVLATGTSAELTVLTKAD